MYDETNNMSPEDTAQSGNENNENISFNASDTEAADRASIKPEEQQDNIPEGNTEDSSDRTADKTDSDLNSQQYSQQYSYTYSQQDTQNYQYSDGAQYDSDNSSGNPYADMSAKDYKENIKRMKKEYKQFQKDQKNAAKAGRYTEAACNTGKKGIGAGGAFILSLATSFVLFVVIFGLIAFFPSKDQSFLASLYGSTSSLNGGGNAGETKNPSGNDVQVGGSTVSKGDNVTINVEGGASGYAQAVYAKAANSVVGIAVSQVSGSKWNQTETVIAMGSGIIYSSDGIIVTNCHVIEYAIGNTENGINSNFAIRVYFKTDLTEWAYATEIIGYDSTNDIAVLKVDASNLNAIEFADSDTLVTGETAIAIGSPGGLTYMNSISEGILSGLNRTVTTDTTVIYDLIQTTAAINPGNSGGALLNKEGKLIGICVIKISSTDYEGMGFAINSNTVKTIVESIIKYGYYNKPVIGVTVNTTYTSDIAASEGWKAGAYIESVEQGSAAEKAGIKKEDIITKINDTTISSFAELRRFLLTCEPGDKITVEIYRPSTNQSLTVEVTLDATAKD